MCFIYCWTLFIIYFFFFEIKIGINTLDEQNDAIKENQKGNGMYYFILDCNFAVWFQRAIYIYIHYVCYGQIGKN